MKKIVEPLTNSQALRLTCIPYVSMPVRGSKARAGGSRRVAGALGVEMGVGVSKRVAGASKWVGVSKRGVGGSQRVMMGGKGMSVVRDIRTLLV